MTGTEEENENSKNRPVARKNFNIEDLQKCKLRIALQLTQCKL